MTEERRAQQEKEVIKKIQEAEKALAQSAKNQEPQSDAEKSFDQQFIVKIKETYKQKSDSSESSTSSESSQ